MMRYVSIVLILLLALSCENTGTQLEREQIAREILDGECKLISNVVTEIASELSENKWFSLGINIASSMACNCIKDKIIPKMAEENSLQEMKILRKTPMKLQKKIKALLQANKQEVKNCFNL